MSANTLSSARKTSLSTASSQVRNICIDQVLFLSWAKRQLIILKISFVLGTYFTK